jgi:hypothetical protein
MGRQVTGIPGGRAKLNFPSGTTALGNRVLPDFFAFDETLQTRYKQRRISPAMIVLTSSRAANLSPGQAVINYSVQYE